MKNFKDFTCEFFIKRGKKFRYPNEKKLKKNPMTMGFEPTRAEPIGLAVQRLNHSATSSLDYIVTKHEN